MRDRERKLRGKNSKKKLHKITHPNIHIHTQTQNITIFIFFCLFFILLLLLFFHLRIIVCVVFLNKIEKKKKKLFVGFECGSLLLVTFLSRSLFFSHYLCFSVVVLLVLRLCVLVNINLIPSIMPRMIINVKRNICKYNFFITIYMYINITYFSVSVDFIIFVICHSLEIALRCVVSLTYVFAFSICFVLLFSHYEFSCQCIYSFLVFF